jgi:hypothetical protein
MLAGTTQRLVPRLRERFRTLSKQIFLVAGLINQSRELIGPADFLDDLRAAKASATALAIACGECMYTRQSIGSVSTTDHTISAKGDSLGFLAREDFAEVGLIPTFPS